MSCRNPPWYGHMGSSSALVRRWLCVFLGGCLVCLECRSAEIPDLAGVLPETSPPSAASASGAWADGVHDRRRRRSRKAAGSRRLSEEDDEEGPQTFMGMKLAGSGSSWWAGLIKSVRSVDVDEELYTSSSRKSAEKRTENMWHLLRSCPEGTRCGFTISPKNSPGVDWAFLGSAPRSCVVEWRRANVIKMTVSIVRRRFQNCLLYTSPSPRDATLSRMPSSA